MDIKEIVLAWNNVMNPDEDIKQIARERRKICDGCEHKKKLLRVNVCGICSCPLKGKTHSPFNTCPENKWTR